MKTEPIYANIGMRIRVLREMKGISQEILARKMNLSRGSIANIEGGNQRLMVHTMIEFAQVLGTKPELFLKKP